MTEPSVSQLAIGELAIHGGSKIRSRPMPSRSAIIEQDEQAVIDVLRYYRKQGLDPGYQGYFEEIYTRNFVEYMGADGFADAVCSGTAAVFVALAALRLPKGSHVIVSPVTDPGTVSAIILNNLVPVVADSMPDSFNMGPEEFAARITEQTLAAIVVHIGGKAAPVDAICAIAHNRGIRVIEDCSQAHGALLHGKRVGTFGDIAVFSTMSRKAHVTGSCGGVVYTKDLHLYKMVRACADRGKSFSEPGFDEKDPASFLFPALNLNCDEISSRIGINSLARLDDTIAKRLAFAKKLEMEVVQNCITVRMVSVCEGSSPFFLTATIDLDGIECGKFEFAEALRAEGLDLNPDYRYVVTEWPWVHRYLYDNFYTGNAIKFREQSFNILFNEHYADEECRDIVNAIRKVEVYYVTKR